MPQAWPIGLHRYVQFLPPDPKAPRVERGAWTDEIKGKRRYGTGVLYRLPGPVPLGVMLGKWGDRPLDLRQRIAAERSRRDHGLRVIREDEEDAVFEGISEAHWYPPFWHWRRYTGIAWRLDIARVDGWGQWHWKRPKWSYRPQPIALGVAFTGDPADFEDAPVDPTVEPDVGWTDEVRALSIEVQRQRLAEEERLKPEKVNPMSVHQYEQIRRIGKEWRDGEGGVSA